MKKITGILFAKVVGRGTMSEGYLYYLKPMDEFAQRWSEILIRKNTPVWQNDPNLHSFLNKKVEIIGQIIEVKKSAVPGSITVDYKEIREVS